MWYKTGTVSVTNASDQVVGAGTDFLIGVNAGEALQVAGAIHEIQSIESATSLTLSAPYVGASETGESYAIVPTQGLVAELATQVKDLITGYTDVKDGINTVVKAGDGSLVAPSVTFNNDQNNGLYKIGSDNWGLVAGGVKVADVLSSNIDFPQGLSATTGQFDTSLNVDGTATMDGLNVDGAGDVAFGTKFFWDASAESLGIGIEPSKKLTVFGTGVGNATVQIEGEGGADPYINFLTNNAQHWSLGVDDSDGDKFKLSEHSALGTNDYLTVDVSGDVLVGKASLNPVLAGHELRATGLAIHTVSGNDVMILNRETSNGVALSLKQGNVSVGSIGSIAGGYLSISGTAGVVLQINGTDEYAWDTTRFYPVNDNANDLGLITKRWDDIFATNGTIQTSDAREKTAVRELTDAEMRVAKKLSKNIGFFQWLSAVEEKGEDARSHCGQTVQGVIAEFEAEGLDAFDYAMVCYNEWEDEFTEHPAIEAVEAVEAVEGVEGVGAVEAVEAVEAVDAWTEQTQEQGDRFSLRTDQLNHFMIRGLSQNQSELEARLSALEE